MKWFEVNNMKANATKFQLMFLSRNKTINTESIIIDGTEIMASPSINILGVEIDHDLKYNLHIDTVTSQIGKQLNAVKRLKQNLDKRSKTTIYNSYINCNFNYCSAVWMFANKSNLEKLEKVNKRALRIVTNNGHLSYDELCKQEHQLTVYRRCIKSIAILIYKVKRGLSPVYLQELVNEQRINYDMKDNDRLTLPAFNTVKYGKNSLKYLGAKLWNIIPVEIKSKPSLNTFKSAVHKWLINFAIDEHI